MEYILIRHADALPLNDDFSRILSSEGIKQCNRQRSTVQSLIKDKKILTYCSPTKRTLQTAKLLGLDSIIECNDLVEPTSDLFVRKLPFADVDLICIIGHNPLLSTLLQEVLGIELELHKADLVYLKERKNKLELVLYQKPLEKEVVYKDFSMIYNELYIQIKSYESLLKEDPTEDIIHELRLVLNQLRSLYLCHKITNKELEHYYKVLGHIRRLDLLLVYTQRSDLLKERTKVVNIVPTLVKDSNVYNTKKVSKNYLKFKKQYKEALSYDFHDARKYLKICIHITQLYGYYEPDLQALKEESKVLGRRHDIILLLKDCKKYKLGEELENQIIHVYQST